MESQSHPQNNKNQRRKRKDPESRDYSCKCGKSYLSYAAAYTHVKNKHKGEKQFLDSIGKPEREKLKRGRPKEKKLISVTEESSRLSILEQTILLIYQSLRENGDIQNTEGKVVLEGNQEILLEQIVKIYDELSQELGDPGLNLFFDRDKYGLNGEIICRFVEGINKHFLPNISVKVIWLINILVKNCSNIENQNSDLFLDFDGMRQLLSEEKIKLLWAQNEKIPLYIIEAFEKWAKITWNIQNN